MKNATIKIPKNPEKLGSLSVEQVKTDENPRPI